MPASQWYEIRIESSLTSANWAYWFEGFAMHHAPDGGTVLRGPVVDQAALYGLLDRLRDLNVRLVSVRRVKGASRVAASLPPGQSQRDLPDGAPGTSLGAGR